MKYESKQTHKPSTKANYMADIEIIRAYRLLLTQKMLMKNESMQTQ